MALDVAPFIKQLDTLIATYEEMVRTSQYEDLSDFSTAERQALVTRSLAAINRIAGRNSTYAAETERLLERAPNLHHHLSHIVGVIQALREDLKAGYLHNLTEILHAEIFSDFLDMAQHLNESGYKDAAAVIAGSTLEGHLRSLALKNGIPTHDTSGKAIKAERLNAELAKAIVYNVLDQKGVTANLDLRNKAAHGSYNDYTQPQVRNLISNIADFVRRMPA